MHFGLIGKTLSHSFSKSYFEKKFAELHLGHRYSNFELPDIAKFPKLLDSDQQLKGFNITNPYKEDIIPFMNELDAEAKQIGAVNCVKIVNGKTKGYNTDLYGFKQSIKPFLEPKHNRALIFGTGGSSKAIAFALKQIGVDYYFVTSTVKKTNNTFFYNELNEIVMKQFLLLINCTPVGMFPDDKNCINIPYAFINDDHLAYDLIYNPTETLFLKQCREKKATTINGLSMLHLQAEKSWEIWMSE